MGYRNSDITNTGANAREGATAAGAASGTAGVRTFDDENFKPAPGENDGKVYMCIDLKSFYASVECADRGLDPFTTNLVVADPSRTEKTICLAITPAMKALGISNRCRVFEIPPAVHYIMAPPRLHHYMEVSVDIYRIYLRYVSPDDIHVYSIDECFIDATPYLKLYRQTPREFARTLMDAVFEETGICATAGIGTNLFLAKVALDITAKHVDDGIGCLTEQSFKETLWDHRPLTDFWNIGPGISRRLAKYSVFDLRGVCELQEQTLYREFGVNAEYLIDHAHGIEPCTIAEIHAYVPESSSLSSGQVLACDYTFEEARIIVREMVDALTMSLVEKHLVAESISLSVGYDSGIIPGSDWYKKPLLPDESPADDEPPATFDPLVSGGSPASGGDGEYPQLATKRRGRRNSANESFKGEHGAQRSRDGMTGGSRKMPWRTQSLKKIMPLFLQLFDETTVKGRAIRRINIGFGSVLPEELASIDLFTDVEAEKQEHDLQEALLAVKNKFGKNAVFKGVSLTEKATARERNLQVGGHRA